MSESNIYGQEIHTAAENANDQILHTRAHSNGFFRNCSLVLSKTLQALWYAATSDLLYGLCSGSAEFSVIACAKKLL